MKKITKLLIAVFAIATSFSSCTKDNSTTTSDPMQGTWTMDSAVLSVPSKDPQQLNVTGTCNTKTYFILKAGYAMEEGDLDPSTCKMTVVSGTWKKTNNLLEITDDNNKTQTFNIISSTANQLVVRDNNVGNGAPDGSYIEATLSKK